MIKIEEITEIECRYHMSNIHRFKVSFWGRLKFLFKGYKAEFLISDEFLRAVSKKVKAGADNG